MKIRTQFMRLTNNFVQTNLKTASARCIGNILKPCFVVITVVVVVVVVLLLLLILLDDSDVQFCDIRVYYIFICN
jgi:hypothetical protein